MSEGLWAVTDAAMPIGAAFDEGATMTARAPVLHSATARACGLLLAATLAACSKGHVQNVLVGRVRGVPKLAHLRMGRRKVVRKEWLDQWMEAHKTS